jgi:hypothetical protein
MYVIHLTYPIRKLLIHREGYQRQLVKAWFRFLWERIQGCASLGLTHLANLTQFSLTLTLLLLVGSYLGLEVAIKEIFPSTAYDVSKYFEREWRLLK